MRFNTTILLFSLLFINISCLSRALYPGKERCFYDNYYFGMNIIIRYKILDNDEYMVCVGFSNLFVDLLSKVGIEATTYSVGVDIGFDEMDAMSEGIDGNYTTEYGAHSRVMVNLVDPKYNINGIYQSDPTWDNIIDEDSYTYSLLTFSEATKAKRYLYQDKGKNELLYSKTISEFYSNVNNYMDDLTKDNTWAIKMTEKNAKIRVVNDMLDTIKK